MDRAGCYKYVDTMIVGTLNRGMDLLNISGITPRKTSNHRAKISIRNSFHGLEIAWRCSGKTGLDDVDV